MDAHLVTLGPIERARVRSDASGGRGFRAFAGLPKSAPNFGAGSQTEAKFCVHPSIVLLCVLSLALRFRFRFRLCVLLLAVGVQLMSRSNQITLHCITLHSTR